MEKPFHPLETKAQTSLSFEGEDFCKVLWGRGSSEIMKP